MAARAGSAISFSPAQGIAATDVQAAIEEDALDLQAHTADSTDAHDASAISVSPSVQGGTDVQGALEALDAAISGIGGSTGLPTNYLTGLKVSNNGSDATNDIDIATGKARDSTDTQDIALGSALVKRLDAGWAAGTNQGMRNSGAAITDTTYHIYLVAKAGGADVDIGTIYSWPAPK